MYPTLPIFNHLRSVIVSLLIIEKTVEENPSNNNSHLDGALSTSYFQKIFLRNFIKRNNSRNFVAKSTEKFAAVPINGIVSTTSFPIPIAQNRYVSISPGYDIFGSFWIINSNFNIAFILEPSNSVIICCYLLSYATEKLFSSI